MPPMPAFYHRPKNIEDVVNHTVARVSIAWACRRRSSPSGRVPTPGRPPALGAPDLSVVLPMYKYGIRNRAFVAFADLPVVRWMQDRLLRYEIAGGPRRRFRPRLAPLDGP